jgi:hypothetical protein
MITILPLNERKRAQIAWIVQAVDTFVTCLKGHTDADVSEACKVAYEKFIRGESGAGSIYSGFDHARKRIRERQTAQIMPFVPRPRT